MALFGSLFKQGSGKVVAAEWADMHLIVGASCQELPAIQRLAELAPDKPLVCFNLKLDILRGDLGLPAFPPKAVHHDFLCTVKPVYYLRPRSYSLSLSVPPFLIAYQGVLFRRCARPRPMTSRGHARPPTASMPDLARRGGRDVRWRLRSRDALRAVALTRACRGAMAAHRPRGLADAP